MMLPRIIVGQEHQHTSQCIRVIEVLRIGFMQTFDDSQSHQVKVATLTRCCPACLCEDGVKEVEHESIVGVVPVKLPEHLLRKSKALIGGFGFTHPVRRATE